MKNLIVILSVIIILFWLYVIYLKLSDFNEFKGEIRGQAFPKNVADVLPYILFSIWMSIASLLAFNNDKLYGMLLNFVIMLGFTIYVGLAMIDAYAIIPCSCAGLFHFNWKEQFYFNLMVTAVSAAGLIFTYKDRERRKSVWTR